MSRWSRRSVLATGSWLVLALAPLASAAPPLPLNVAANPLDALQQRSAEERWQRLKNQFPAAESGRPDQPATRGNKLVRRIPDDEEPAALPDNAFPETQDVAVEELRASPEATPVESDLDELPFPLLPSEPVWILTVAPPAEELSEAPPAPANPSAPANPPVEASPPAEESVGRVAVQEERPAAPSLRGDPLVPNAPRTELRVKTIGEIRIGGVAIPDSELRAYSRQEAEKLHVSFGDQTFTPRNFVHSVALFDAPDLSYYPLYFHDPALERYGHTYGPLVQPAVSVARFGVQLVGLPYQMTIDPPWCLQTGLGWLDPGDCNPKLCYQIPWNTKAALVEAGTITGLIFLIP